MSRAFDLLGLHVSAGPDAIKKRWVELAKLHDPMVGGNTAKFNELRLAYKEATAIALAPMACAKCAGTGRILSVTKVVTSRTTCPDCKGAGCHQGGAK